MNRGDADVIVLGAGAAGLAAAHALAKNKLRVVVLEGRDRVGGRVWTQEFDNCDGAVELGAEFIHGPAEATRELLREAGGTAMDTDGTDWRLGPDGRLYPSDEDFVAAAGILGDALSLPIDETVEQFLSRFRGDAATLSNVHAARAFVEGFDAADPAIASALAIAQEWTSGADFASARPSGGYRPVFDRLRDDGVAAGVQLLLSTVVHRIMWSAGSVEVMATNGSELRKFHARACVVTLPVGVLRHGDDESAVVFDPELPPAKREALAKIEMGHVVRVVLGFPTPFWMRLADGRYRDAGFFRCAEGPFGAYWTQFPQRTGLIVAWVGGPRAIALSNALPSDRIDLARDQLGEMFGDPAIVRRELENAATHDWSADPFARGAYSYVAVGGGDARNVLGSSVDATLFFAGEATSTNGQGGTVNGALETGQRAALEAAKVLEARG